jgi:hypothetical protein
MIFKRFIEKFFKRFIENIFKRFIVLKSDPNYDRNLILINLFTGKLISPTNLEQSSLNLLPKSNLTRRGSSSSLLSIMNSSGDPHIRVCKDCKMLLNRRDQQIEDKQSKPILSQFYERMRQHMKEVEKLMPLYYQMSDSLRYLYFKLTIK